MFQIGITERGDAALDLSWVTKLRPANIIISKSFNSAFNDALLQYSDKIIYHCTCTGFGSSILEPNVPSSKAMVENLTSLIKDGFPPQNIVLRIDPIIPVNIGLQRLENTLRLFIHLPITRVRYSFLDMYQHVKDRFRSHNISLPYTTFHASVDMQQSALDILSKYEKYYDFESCAENTPHKRGCISNKDLQILNISADLIGSANQRSSCLCPANKVELLSNRRQCKHGCLYCFWK